MSDKAPSKERTFGEPWNDTDPRYSGKNGQIRQIAITSAYPYNPCEGKRPVGTRNLPNEE